MAGNRGSGADANESAEPIFRAKSKYPSLFPLTSPPQPPGHELRLAIQYPCQGFGRNLSRRRPSHFKTGSVLLQSRGAVSRNATNRIAADSMPST
jgi:hypothetical protein